MKKNTASFWFVKFPFLNVHAILILAPGVWVLSVFKFVLFLTWGLKGAGSEAPQGLRSSKCYKLVFLYVIVVIGTHLILLVF